jgi:hypothetical protein
MTLLPYIALGALAWVALDVVLLVAWARLHR